MLEGLGDMFLLLLLSIPLLLLPFFALIAAIATNYYRYFLFGLLDQIGRFARALMVTFCPLVDTLPLIVSHGLGFTAFWGRQHERLMRWEVFRCPTSISGRLRIKSPYLPHADGPTTGVYARVACSQPCSGAAGSHCRHGRAVPVHSTFLLSFG